MKLTFDLILNLFLAIAGAQRALKALQPGQEEDIDIPDVAFSIGKTRYDITFVKVKRAE